MLKKKISGYIFPLLVSNRLNFRNMTLNRSFVPSPKTSIKWLDVPIQKFNTAVPHFVEVLKSHHSKLIKLQKLNNWDEMYKEMNSASRTVSQISSLMTEMDNLRDQVLPEELAKFDKLISNSKQSASNLLECHQDLISSCCRSKAIYTHDVNEESRDEEANDNKLQIIAHISNDIRTQEQKAAALESLQGDIEDMNYLFQELSQIVHDQGESVERVEEHVETTHQNVVEGERMLCQAAKYKNGMYPLIGALVGSFLGGPIGMFAGFKLGGLTAVGCGLIGFTGGKILKDQSQVTSMEADLHREGLTD